jgi:hypothetical protein
MKSLLGSLILVAVSVPLTLAAQTAPTKPVPATPAPVTAATTPATAKSTTAKKASTRHHRKSGKTAQPATVKKPA